MIEALGFFDRPLALTAAHAEAVLWAKCARRDGEVWRMPSAQAALSAAPVLMAGTGRRVCDWRPLALPAGMVEGLAVVRVAGFLVAGAHAPRGLPGLCNVAEVRRQIARAADDATIRAVALDVDTHGGDPAEVFELAAEIRELRARKPVWAIISDRALAGGFAIAAAADRVILSRLATVGGIDALALLFRAGPGGAVEVRILRAATMAAARGESDLGRWWHDLPGLRNELAAAVAAARAPVLTTCRVLGTCGATYQGHAAVRAGLADDVAAPAVALQRLAEAAGLRRAVPGRRAFPWRWAARQEGGA